MLLGTHSTRSIAHIGMLPDIARIPDYRAFALYLWHDNRHPHVVFFNCEQHM